MREARQLIEAAIEVERSFGLIREARAAVADSKAQGIDLHGRLGGLGVGIEPETGPDRASRPCALANPEVADRDRAEELLREASAAEDPSERSWLISQAVHLYMRADDASGPPPEFRVGWH